MASLTYKKNKIKKIPPFLSSRKKFSGYNKKNIDKICGNKNKEKNLKIKHKKREKIRKNFIIFCLHRYQGQWILQKNFFWKFFNSLLLLFLFSQKKLYFFYKKKKKLSGKKN